MYNEFFGFREAPFSIAPDPRYLYLSERHKEALAHLMYGVQGQGGFIVITGEVGTGKTTVCRCFLDSVPDHVDIALVLNPKLSARELLASICDELQLRYPAGASIKRLIDLINGHLLTSHSQGRHTVLVIDEAQNLTPDVLEQLRLLTNLETGEKKLLQIVLLGQPELQEMLAERKLRQLSQRITARYHLSALNREELPSYLRYRLSVAGSRQVVFLPPAVKVLYRLSKGIPRLVNLIADRALLGAYAQGSTLVDARTVRQAGQEVLGDRKIRAAPGKHTGRPQYVVLGSLLACILAIAGLTWSFTVADLGRFGGGQKSGPQTETVPHTETVANVEMAENQSADTEDSTAPGQDASAPEPVDRSAAANLELAPLEQVPPAKPDYPTNLLASWSDTGDSTVEAYRQLFQLWGLRYENSRFHYACDFAEQEGLRCLHRQGNWRSLEQLDRPAVLRLHNREGEGYHVTLLKLDGDKARIALGREHYTLPRSAVDEHWLGEYSIIWRAPPYDSVVTGSDVDKTAWLTSIMETLREHYGVDAGQAEALSKAALDEQVAWFQRRVGLIPDGIPGEVTLISINSILDPTVPRLLTPPDSNHLARQN